jgi:hypothetical protein
MKSTSDNVARERVSARDAVTESVIAPPERGLATIPRMYRELQWHRTVRRAVLPVLLLALWQYASTAGLFDPSFVPSPTTVLAS